MSIFRRLWLAFAGDRQADRYAVQDGHGLWLFFRCARCGEKIKLRVRKTSEIQSSDSGAEYAYFVKKTVVGQECFNRIEALVKFDSRYRVIDSEVRNGELITAEAFSQNRSPEEEG